MVTHKCVAACLLPVEPLRVMSALRSTVYVEIQLELIA